MKHLLSLAVLSLVVSCSGPQHVYKDFYESSSKLGKVAVGADGVVLEDKSGQKADAFIKNESKMMAQQLHGSVKAVLRSKGYAVSRNAFTSTGLSLPDEMTAFAVNHRSEDSGQFFTKPYSFTSRSKSKTQKYAAQKLTQRLLKANLLSKDATQEVFSEVADLGVSSNEYLCVVLGLSRNVHAGKQIAQALGTAILSLGTISYAEPDIGLIQVALIDPRTKKIVWANQVFCKSNREAVIGSVSSALEELPPHN